MINNGLALRRSLAAVTALLMVLGLALVSTVQKAWAATPGVTTTLNLDSFPVYDGKPVLQEGAAVTLVVNYNSQVLPGSTVEIELPSQFDLPTLPAGNTGISSITREGDIVKITFQDPFPSTVNQGVLGLNFTVNAVTDSSVENIEWVVDGEPSSATVIILESGDETENVQPGYDKTGTRSNWQNYFTVVDGVVGLVANPAKLSYTLRINSDEDQNNLVIADELPPGLSYVTDSFTLTTTAWDSYGLNKTTTTVQVPASDSRLDISNVPATGSSFEFTDDFDAATQVELKYQVEITDASAFLSDLQTKYDALGVTGGQATTPIKNEVSFGGTSDDFTISLGVSKEGLPGIGTDTFGKTSDWDYDEATIAENGDLTPPLDAEYTFTAKLRAFDGSNAPKTLTSNVVISDTFPAGFELDVTDQNFITITDQDGLAVSGFTQVSSSVDLTNVSRDDFKASQYFKQWAVKTDSNGSHVFFLNLGNETDKDYTVTLKTKIKSVNGFTNVASGYQGGEKEQFVNTAYFLYNTAYTTRSKTIEIEDRGDGGDTGWNNPQIFNKTSVPSNVTLNPGESANIQYTLVLNTGHGVDLGNSKVVDYVDTSVFDLSDFQAVKDSTVVKYNSVMISDTNYNIELVGTNIEITLTDAGKDLVALNPNRTFEVVFTLKTIVFPARTSADVNNSAAVIGSNNVPIWWQTTSLEATSYGDELEVRKSVRDSASSEWTSSVRAEIDSNGDLVEDQYVYRIDVIPHGNFVSYHTNFQQIIDTLPAEVEFVGFLANSDVDTHNNVITTDSTNIGGNLQAEYDSVAGTVTIKTITGTKMTAGTDVGVNILVKIKDGFEPDEPIVNTVSQNSATIIPSEAFPITIQKLDSQDISNVISDPNAIFQILDDQGDVVVDNVFVENGFLRVKDDQGNSKSVVVPQPGTYTVVEVKSPWGYNLTSTTVNVTVAQNGSTGATVPTFWNDPNTDKSYAIGDYTWIDEDRDGIQDATEPVLVGVTVEIADTNGDPITDVFGNPVPATTTDANGLYVFDDLPAGEYVITFTLTDAQKEKYVFTELVGTPIDDDSDATPTSADPGIGKTVSITLDDTNTELDTSYTNASGTVVRASEGIDPTWDAGVVLKSYAIGDYTWIDENRDGIQDASEPVLTGVKVEITDENGDPVTDVRGNPVGSTATDLNGLYVFDELPAGEYVITFTLTDAQKAKYIFTDLVGTPVDDDSDATPTSADPGVGKTVKITLDDTNTEVTTTYTNASNTVIKATQGIDPTWDAGVVLKSYAIGDYTWIDENRDGIQDASEPVLPGVKVEITDENGNPVKDVYGNTVTPTTTDENGRYKFDELPAGEYVITFTLTDEQKKIYEFTSQDVGSDDAVESDANPTTGKTVKIVLGDSNTNLTKTYTVADVKATEGIDPTWDAGVVLKQTGALPDSVTSSPTPTPSPTPSPSPAGDQDVSADNLSDDDVSADEASNELAETGMRDMLPITVALVLMLIAGLAMVVVSRRRV